ncbi:uncharacterized protein JCM15063_000038 [Sporobolomyces koalae]|uniref:uncharacterized protein n=1 Tax=Sporobolomyces koalae TaxID=500713 RepID=UPI00317E5F2B
MPPNAVLEKAEAYQFEHLEDKGEAHSLEANPVVDLNAAATKALVRKIDWVIQPLFFLIYLITFIDRANVGNARVAGLTNDLKLVGYQYNISLTVFYIFYALWEIPSNIVCRALGAKRWVALQIVLFGAVCLATGFIHNFGQFVAVRILLGLAEGGVLPALSLVLSRFYTRAELVFRIGILVSAASLAGGFGGLLASGFISIGPIRGVGLAWRNIFLFEGLITIVIGIASYFLVPSDPQTAWFLTPEERTLAVERLVARTGPAPAPISKETQRRLTFSAFTALPTWLCAFGYLATNVSVQGVSLFLPTIIRALYPGLPTVQVQLRTVPPYVVAFFWSLGLAYLSNRIDRRGFVMLCSSPFALAGYVTFVATNLPDIHARYAGAFLCILGAFPLGPFFLAWAANNAATDTERGIASGIVPGFGQFGAIIATWSYLPHDGPNYYTGNSINIGFSILCWSITATTLTYLIWENRARRAGKRDHRLAEVRDDEDAPAVLGSRHPAFIYSI